MADTKKKIASLLLVSCLLFSGCVRVAGKTGYWYKGSEDEEAKAKQVGFDTQDLVDPNRAPGSITT